MPHSSGKKYYTIFSIVVKPDFLKRPKFFS
jgi:hypothetical protein